MWWWDQLTDIQRKVTQMAVDFTKLEASVAAQEVKDDIVIQLLTDLSAEVAALKGASTDPATQAKIDALQGTLDAGIDKLAAAVAANQP
jgi:hypothetical protein